MFNALKFLHFSIPKTIVPIVPICSICEMSSETNPNLAFKKPKYDGRTKKRKWEERRSDKGAALYPVKRICDEDFVRIKRKKYAMLLGYCGVDYFGMQRNPESKTIEEDLFSALLKTNLITQEAYEQIQTIQFQRAARTDKGVSAARQIVSIKLPEEVDVAKINENLPEVIKVFGVKRVTQGFNSKNNCDGRTYMYMLPTISFAKNLEGETQESFRLKDEDLLEINSILTNFLGTKNYHNFTNRKKARDPSAKRYILNFECEQPFVRKGVEFAVLKVRGQSFMLHQIRKMVGLTLALVKGLTPMETLGKAWTLEELNIPYAPGLGLVLEKVHYERYNYRYGNDGMHEDLDWTEFNDQVEEFKEKYIYPTIIDTEVNEQVMINWINDRLQGHNFFAPEEPSKDNEEGNGDDDEDNGPDEDVNDVAKEKL